MNARRHLFFECSECEYASKPDEPFDLVVDCRLKGKKVHLSQTACSIFSVDLAHSIHWVNAIIKAIDMRIERKTDVSA